jgi:hypothetical protein
MMSRGSAAISVLLLTSVSRAVYADPIKAQYQITVREHCTHVECVPVNVVFPLTVTFDSVPVRDEVTATSRLVQYGAPTFSAVPFERPEVAAGATEFRYTIDIAFLLGAPSLPPYRRVANATHSQQLLTDEIDYRWNLYLYAGADTHSVAVLGARSFARFLAQGDNDDGDPNDAGLFAFGFAALDRRNAGQWLPGSFSYLGFAELDEASPVPEPGTLALLATALAGAAVERRRRRSRQP